MTFSEALDQYLEARDKLRELEEVSGDYGRTLRQELIARKREAAARMDELAPVQRP